MGGFIALGKKKYSNKEKQCEWQMAWAGSSKVNVGRPEDGAWTGQSRSAWSCKDSMQQSSPPPAPHPHTPPPHTPFFLLENPSPGFLAYQSPLCLLSPFTCWLPGSLRRGCVTVTELLQQQPCTQGARAADQTCFSVTSLETHGLCPVGKTKKTPERKGNPPAFAAHQYSVQVLVK